MDWDPGALAASARGTHSIKRHRLHSPHLYSSAQPAQLPKCEWRTRYAEHSRGVVVSMVPQALCDTPQSFNSFRASSLSLASVPCCGQARQVHDA